MSKRASLRIPADRGFGALLERLTERADAAPPAIAASTERDIEERAAASAMCPPQRAAHGDEAFAASMDVASQAAPETGEEPPVHAIQSVHAPPESVTPGNQATAVDPALADARQKMVADEPARIDRGAPAYSACDPSVYAAALQVADAAELSVTPAAMPEPAEASTMPVRRSMHAALAAVALIVLGLMLAARFPGEPERRVAQAPAAPAATRAGGAPGLADAGPKQAASDSAAFSAIDAASVLPASSDAVAAVPVAMAETPDAEATTARMADAAASAMPATAPVPAPPPSLAQGARRPIAAAPPAPALLILVSGGRDNRRMRALVQGLARRGVANVRISPTSRRLKSTDLRYFHPEARDAALNVRQALTDAGYRAPAVTLIPRHGKRAPQRSVELWLAGDRAAVPGARPQKTAKGRAATAAPRMRTGGRS